MATVTDLQFSLFGACVAFAWIIPSATNKILWSNMQQRENWTALAYVNQIHYFVAFTLSLPSVSTSLNTISFHLIQVDVENNANHSVVSCIHDSILGSSRRSSFRLELCQHICHSWFRPSRLLSSMVWSLSSRVSKTFLYVFVWSVHFKAFIA